MLSTSSAPLLESIPPLPRRLRLTRGDCAVLEQSGQFEKKKAELVEGDLIEKMGKKRPHSESWEAIARWLFGVFSIVNSETSIDVAPEDNPTSEPEPDLIVLKHRVRDANPKPEDLLLVVEISDSTLRFDLTVKAGLYARAGILDYWVLDVAGHRIGVHRDPQSGVYQSVRWYGEGENVSPLAAPDARLAVADAFPGEGGLA